MGWRDYLRIHPAADVFPMMSPDELRELGEDIGKNGLNQSIVLWQCGTPKHRQFMLLDGRNRLDAMELVGLLKPLHHAINSERKALEVWGISSVWLEPPVDPYDFVMSANLHRRHLTSEQKRDVIAKLLKHNPDRSNRQIGRQVGVSPHTVGDVRADLERREQIAHVETRTDSLGRDQPAHKSKPEPSSPPDDIDPADAPMGYQERADRWNNEQRRKSQTAPPAPATAHLSAPQPDNSTTKIINIATSVRRWTTNVEVIALCDWVLDHARRS
jgi:hypothetical protein